MRALAALDAKYNDCPFECPAAPREKRWDVSRGSLCEGCMRRRARNDFKRAVARELGRKMPGSPYRFEDLERAIDIVVGAQGAPAAEVSMRLAPLAQCLATEKKRFNDQDR